MNLWAVNWLSAFIDIIFFYHFYLLKILWKKLYLLELSLMNDNWTVLTALFEAWTNILKSFKSYFIRLFYALSNSIIFQKIEFLISLKIFWEGWCSVGCTLYENPISVAQLFVMLKSNPSFFHQFYWCNILYVCNLWNKN